MSPVTSSPSEALREPSRPGPDGRAGTKRLERLLETSQEVLFDQPRQGLEQARRALETIDREARRLAEPSRSELAARAALGLANALRVVGDLPQAEAAFERARGRIDEVPDALLRRRLDARRYDLLASLYNDQRRFPEAVASIDRALALYRRLGDERRQARAWINKGHVLETAGARNQSLRAFRQALARLDPHHEPRQFAICMHNLLRGLHRAGYTIAALSLLGDVRALYEALGDETPRLRLLWLEAEMLLEIGREAVAESLFEEVRAGFVELDMPYDAALVSLDLAALYLEQNRAYKLRDLALRLFPVFQSHKVHREAMAALILYREALATHALDLDLIARLGEYLQKAPGSPELAFRY